MPLGTLTVDGDLRTQQLAGSPLYNTDLYANKRGLPKPKIPVVDVDRFADIGPLATRTPTGVVAVDGPVRRRLFEGGVKLDEQREENTAALVRLCQIGRRLQTFNSREQRPEKGV